MSLQINRPLGPTTYTAPAQPRGGSGDPDHVAIVTEVDGNGRPTRIVETYDFNLPARERDVSHSMGSVIGYARA